MIRAIGPSVLLFLLPFLLFFAWNAFQRRPGRSRAVPYLKLSIVGLVLALGGLLFFLDPTADEPRGIYIPPRYENGQVVPGHFAPHPKGQP
ncbi:DUF6111 family protein [Terrihabitans rhizophilus]|uniref:DUF6111 family protein n=1 Tax=Terrihabitans rhizophilus TaxID=3092662 RepID=A0ABU4RU58_9HYPH|nr:DUF6111 family protein [Terrihabitans sp. PJ23]MDX6806371.1 DUF6111 family protein [Terrihabitans sp. PJ23]